MIHEARFPRSPSPYPLPEGRGHEDMGHSSSSTDAARQHSRPHLAAGRAGRGPIGSSSRSSGSRT